MKRSAPLGLLAVFAALVLLKWSALTQPYHWDVIGYVANTAYDMLDNGFRLIHPYDTGHPPLFFLALALTWKVFGTGLLPGHLLVLAVAAIGIVYTYRLGNRLGGWAVGVAAAGLTLFNQIVFAQMGTLNLSTPLMSLSVAATYYYLMDRKVACAVAGTLLVMVHEAALVVPAVLGVHCLWKAVAVDGFRRSWVRCVPLVIPAIVLAAWFLYHRAQLGWMVNTGLLYNKDQFLEILRVNLTRHFVYDTTDDQVNRFNWIITLAMAGAVLRAHFSGRGILRGANQVFLLLGIVLAHVVLFSYSDDLPRYFVPALPFYFVLGAWALRSLLSHWKGADHLLLGATVVVCCLFTFGYRSNRSGPGWQLESNLDYADMIATHKAAAQFLERHHPTEPIASCWPMGAELGEPRNGYIKTPLPGMQADGPVPRGSLIYYSPESGCGDDPKVLALISSAKLVRRWEIRGKTAAIYRLDDK